MNYSFPKLLETLIEGQGLVLAMIVEAEGSTPQVVGASAIFSDAGLVAGTVGGGLLEGRVDAAAREALRDGKARLISVRLDADPSDMEGAICGGAVRVLVDPGVARDRPVFEKALEGGRTHRPGYLRTGIRTIEGDIVSVKRNWRTADGSSHDAPPDTERGDFRGEGGFDGTGSVVWPRLFKGEKGLTFIEFVQPLPRLIIAGAGHVGRAVARLGNLLDFSVTVIDDRPEFANAGGVPEADEIIVGDIGESVGRIEVSAGDYFVIVTRGHQKDAEALRAVIGRPAAYVGMIGSRSKINIMRSEFLECGWATEDDWAKVHAPIGLDIGSKTVEEIAVSIAAELIFVRSKRKDAGRGQP
jgi:xanthine dehydrogenase accessory factor